MKRTPRYIRITPRRTVWDRDIMKVETIQLTGRQLVLRRQLNNEAFLNMLADYPLIEAQMQTLAANTKTAMAEVSRAAQQAANAFSTVCDTLANLTMLTKHTMQDIAFEPGYQGNRLVEVSMVATSGTSAPLLWVSPECTNFSKAKDAQ